MVMRTKWEKFVPSRKIPAPGYMPEVNPYYPYHMPYDLETGQMYPYDESKGLYRHTSGMYIDEGTWFLFDPKEPNKFYDILTLERVNKRTGKPLKEDPCEYWPCSKPKPPPGPAGPYEPPGDYSVWYPASSLQADGSWIIQYTCPWCKTEWTVHVEDAETTTVLYCHRDGNSVRVPIPIP